MRRALPLPALALLTALSSFAQTGSWGLKPVAEPEFANVFFRMDDAGNLMPLERQAPANIRTKSNGFIVVNAKAVFEFPGAKSPVRFSRGALEFAVRTLGQFDPYTMYHLRKLDIKKKTREMLVATAHATPFGGTSSTRLNQGDLAATFTRYGNASLKMTVDLAPGEYALQASASPTGAPVFCFGVD